MVEINGTITGQGLKIGIVVARFNELVTNKLLQGSESELLKYSVNKSDITVAWVPGAMEIPRIVKKMAETKKFDGIIALGAVIRGETSHYDYVCEETANGIASQSLNGPVPVMFGVLTTNTLDQAINRAGGKAGNKGADCARGVLDLIYLERQLIK
ncbi:6,7-dimethyl-8-ribityllumazine synthase [Oenococcus sp. UCMA 16435]|nr:6,7-dimethyl-8-ribityllumazine synthase [Oenococcus sp. UCMA 16435]MDI4583948.1 6,7-dimethyl-8-ribityllumazine synthase [Oenococcus sp. UCMA 14587]